MAKKAETLSYQEAWRRNYRAFRMGWEKYPNWYRSCLLKGIFSAATPYVTIYISARIINELAGQRRPGTLVSLVLVQVISAAVLALVNGVLTRWHSREDKLVNYQEKKILTDKTMDMDFVDLDSQRVSDLLYQIAQNTNWMGWGVIRVRDIFEGFVTALTQIIGGVALALGLFLRPVPAESRLAFLNHPLFTLLVLVLLLGVALLGPSFANKAENYWNGYADMGKLVNRQFGAFGGKVRERKLALDQRIYSQSEKHLHRKDEGRRRLWPEFLDCPQGAGADGPSVYALRCAFRGDDGAGIPVCVPEGLGRGLWRRLHHAVCGGYQQPVFGHLHPDSKAGRYAGQRHLSGAVLRPAGHPEQHVSGQSDHRKAERQAV
ncbi:MAG: hypothetical protein LUD79_08495 [Oscillospiraceae bacterium]|nr:hypothetical protein [Oscillospiraceae bacterium]